MNMKKTAPSMWLIRMQIGRDSERSVSTCLQECKITHSDDIFSSLEICHHCVSLVGIHIIKLLFNSYVYLEQNQHILWNCIQIREIPCEHVFIRCMHIGLWWSRRSELLRNLNLRNSVPIEQVHDKVTEIPLNRAYFVTEKVLKISQEVKNKEMKKPVEYSI